MSRSTDYIYGTAHIRCMESKLLSRNAIERMISAEDFTSAVSVLSDLDYGKHLANLGNQDAYREAIDLVLLDTKALLHESAPADCLTFLWISYDAQNLRILCKAFVGKQTAQEGLGLSPLGDLDVEDISAYLEQPEESSSLPQCVQDALAHAVALYAEHGNGEAIDWVIDGWLMRKLADQVRTHRGPIKRYLESIIDLTAVKTVIRLGDRLAECDLDLLVPLTCHIDRNRLLSMDNTLGSWKELLVHADLESAFPAIETLIETQNYADLERTLHDLSIDALRPTKWQAYGPDPLAAYFLARITNGRIIAAILSGKQNRLSREEIETYLPKSFV